MKTQLTTDKKHIYSVSELTKNVRQILEENFGELWIEGEISNFTRHQSGHMYFSIKDEKSVLLCVFFRGNNVKARFEIKNGMQVVCFGRISVYDKRGQYQFYVETMDPKGRGALQVAFEQLKEKLFKEGLFDETRKRQIPYLPERVGVITSPTGAAIRDILNVAKRRFSNIEIIINPVRVQGENAKNEIKEAIEVFNRLKNIDVIIVGRGGGSLEDLWAFNEEIVARAISGSEIPIISAVGHEIDWTISDFVSDFRAPTPSAAAELVIPKKEDLQLSIKGLLDRMKTTLLSQLEFFSEKLNRLGKRYVFREPFNLVTQHEQEIDDLAKDMASKGAFFVKMKEETLKNLVGKLDALSPIGILGRGYSITKRLKDNVIVRDAGILKKNDRINIRLAKGEVIGKVENIVMEDLWQK